MENGSDIEVLNTSLARIWTEENFLRVEFHRDVRIELGEDESKQLIEDSWRVCKGKLHGVIWDGRGSEIVVTPESRELFASSKKATEYRRAVAFVLDSLPNRLSANFFVKFNKPPAPAAVFETVEEAKSWLSSLNL